MMIDTIVRPEVTEMQAFVEAQQLIGQQNRYHSVYLRAKDGGLVPFKVAYRFTTEHEFGTEPVAVTEIIEDESGVGSTRQQRLGNWIGELAAATGRFLDPTSIDRIASSIEQRADGGLV